MGTGVGAADGWGVGAGEGIVVGSAVGRAVGADEGASDGALPPAARRATDRHGLVLRVSSARQRTLGRHKR